jgi:hypothetical protein
VSTVMSTTEVMTRHLTEFEIMGHLDNDQGFPVELEMVVCDNEGQEYSLDVMTLGRYLETTPETTEPEEPDTLRVFVVNEPAIVMESLVELLKSPPIDVWRPYLHKLEDPEA